MIVENPDDDEWHGDFHYEPSFEENAVTFRLNDNKLGTIQYHIKVIAEGGEIYTTE